MESVDNRCAYEYTTLTSEKIPADQVEVCIDGNVINMFIKLIVNLPLTVEGKDSLNVQLINPGWIKRKQLEQVMYFLYLR